MGIGKYLKENETVNLIGTFGFAIAFTKGEAEQQGVKFIHNYETEVFVRFGLGIEIEQLFDPNFGIAFGARGFIGDQTRDVVDVKNGNSSVTFIPIGTTKLQDNTISLYFNFQYSFIL